LLSRVLQLGLSLGSLGTALRALASGDFAEAKRAALEFKDQAADAAKGLGTDLSAGIRAGLDQADGFLRRSSGRAKVWWDETKDNVLSNWAKISGTFQTLFGGTSSTSPQSPTKPAGAAASLSNPEAEKQVKELLAKVNADYEAAFSERQVIIDLAYAREITALNNAFVASKNLRVEDLANDEEYQRAKEQIEALYAQRSLQNARDAAQQKRDVAAGQLHNAALGMTAGGNALGNFLGVSDPYAGPKQTVATGNADLIGIQKDLLAAQQELADAATKSEDDRIRAQEKINALIEKQITTQQGVANAERNINAQRVQGVQSMFADMATIAKAFGKKGFEVAKGIAIAGAIIHTAEAAVIAYKNGLELGGPYAGWLLGPLFAGVATAAGAAQIATIASQQPATGYERGGLVTGGEKVIRVNETGRPEFVMNADATARNLSLLKSLNAARNRPIALPITSSTESLQANAPGLQQGGGGTAAPNVNVAAPPAQIVIVDSEEMAHQVLMSGRFKEAVVRTFKDNRGELGFET
jgi:hypothetical protein